MLRSQLWKRLWSLPLMWKFLHFSQIPHCPSVDEKLKLFAGTWLGVMRSANLSCYITGERAGKVWELFPQRLLPSLQFLDRYGQEEVLSVQDGMEALVSWNELKEINCPGWQHSANSFGQTVPLDACVALQFLTEWNLSHKISYEDLLQTEGLIQ